ncbi:8-amino-7-oxononanoate synthase [Thermomonas haemolytica]|uniref:8-amino-7-oxononanoate synthase n=1 Tax=Thermomonas haemolytica TaxID=141949 RepID=A0A4V2V2H4_9GAMM|nr:8-amino-7-oxononanoate synthase [Thermomonas haemolytica]TCT25123.1 8-amino-7-oxononanoate synthase [Thermomonas haemolytica]TNY30368.1 8-amino-7-oxononanoate synthase [Thermomonas haemolytica]
MPRPLLTARVAALREQRIAQQRLRLRRTVLRRDGMRCEVQDAGGGSRWLLDFCGNDYLGLARHYSVAGALQDAAARTGAGGVASHLVCGHRTEHVALERAVADWLQAPAALLLGSGYAANLAVVQALLGKDDVCVQDRLNHASLIDGARLAGCALRRYPHADAEAALRQLRAAPEGAALLASDGVFSMDGDVAPLRALALVARAQRATLYIDEAHAIGVLGETGRGSVAAAGLDHGAVPLRLVTLGKALGSYGALVVGDADLVRHLAETARPYIYTTALPPALAAAALAAVQRARRDEWRREQLAARVRQFREGARRLGLPLLDSDTPIQPLLCGSDANALAMAAALEHKGLWVAAIRPPTVPEGSARLRITLSAGHAPRDVEQLLDALAVVRDAVAAGATPAAHA